MSGRRAGARCADAAAAACDRGESISTGGSTGSAGDGGARAEVVTGEGGSAHVVGKSAVLLDACGNGDAAKTSVDGSVSVLIINKLKKLLQFETKKKKNIDNLRKKD